MGEPGPIRVAVADDDYLVRRGAAAVLSDVDGVELVGTAGHPAELEALVAEHGPDVVILDIRMPPSFTTEGIDLARALRVQQPDLGIVVLSQHADPEYAAELMDIGPSAVAYLLKERLGDVDQLVEAIRTVAAGGSALDPRIVETVLDVRRQPDDSPLATLTPREGDVLALMASGRANAAIAAQLGVSERSVEKHTNAIFVKLGLRETPDINRRVAAVVLYLQAGDTAHTQKKSQ